MGVPQIQTGTLAAVGAIASGKRFLSAAEVVKMKIRYFAAVIDSTDDLAREGFDYLRRQRYAARSGKRKVSPITRAIEELVTFENAGLSAKELWPRLLGKTSSLRVSEITTLTGRPRLTWEDDDTGRSGKLTFGTFEKKLSGAKRAAGLGPKNRK